MASFGNLDRNFNPIRNRVRYRNVHPSSNRIFFTIQLFQKYKNLITPGSDLYPGKVVDIKYNGKISSTFSELSSEPVIQFVTNKNKTTVFHGGPRDYEENRLSSRSLIRYYH